MVIYCGLNWKAGFMWLIAWEQLTLIKGNIEDLVNDMLSFFPLSSGAGENKQLLGSKQKGPAAFPRLLMPNWNWLIGLHFPGRKAVPIYTAAAFGNPRSVKYDISGRERQSGRNDFAKHSSLVNYLQDRTLLRSRQRSACNPNGGTATLGLSTLLMLLELSQCWWWWEDMARYPWCGWDLKEGPWSNEIALKGAD